MARAATEARIAVGGCSVDGVGIRFKRNRSSRRSFKDLFAGRDRRTRPGEFWALRGRQLHGASPGESIGVVGRNGQGKSTLLKLVAQVMFPDDGEVHVSGGRRAADRDHRRLRQRPHGARQRLPDGGSARHDASSEIDQTLRRDHRVRRDRRLRRHPVQAPLERDEGAHRVLGDLAARGADHAGRRGARRRRQGVPRQVLSSGSTSCSPAGARCSSSRTANATCCASARAASTSTRARWCSTAPIQDVLDRYNADYNSWTLGAARAAPCAPRPPSRGRACPPRARRRPRACGRHPRMRACGPRPRAACRRPCEPVRAPAARPACAAATSASSCTATSSSPDRVEVVVVEPARGRDAGTRARTTASSPPNRPLPSNTGLISFAVTPNMSSAITGMPRAIASIAAVELTVISPSRSSRAADIGADEMTRFAGTSSACSSSSG